MKPAGHTLAREAVDDDECQWEIEGEEDSKLSKEQINQNFNQPGGCAWPGEIIMSFYVINLLLLIVPLQHEEPAEILKGWNQPLQYSRVPSILQQHNADQKPGWGDSSFVGTYEKDPLPGQIGVCDAQPQGQLLHDWHDV